MEYEPVRARACFNLPACYRLLHAHVKSIKLFELSRGNLVQIGEFSQSGRRTYLLITIRPRIRTKRSVHDASNKSIKKGRLVRPGLRPGTTRARWNFWQGATHTHAQVLPYRAADMGSCIPESGPPFFNQEIAI